MLVRVAADVAARVAVGIDADPVAAGLVVHVAPDVCVASEVIVRVAVEPAFRGASEIQAGLGAGLVLHVAADLVLCGAVELALDLPVAVLAAFPAESSDEGLLQGFFSDAAKRG